MAHNTKFKGRPLFDVEHLGNDVRQGHSYNRASTFDVKVLAYASKFLRQTSILCLLALTAYADYSLPFLRCVTKPVVGSRDLLNGVISNHLD